MLERVPPLALAILLGAAVPAGAQSSLYAAGGAGRSTLDSFDSTAETKAAGHEAAALPSVAASGVAGIDFGVFRIEGEALLDGRKSDDPQTVGGDLDGDGDIHTVAGMANLFIDIPTSTRVTPFFGGGLGYAEVAATPARESELATLNIDDGGVAYQLRAGFAVAVSPTANLTFGYRYFEAKSLGASHPDGRLDAPRAHIAELGLRITF